jgi:predicted RNA binding protein YcfA (HicA-like mRNA interferase family)
MPVKVRDVLRRLKSEGWLLVQQTGSHRQFKHAKKPGRVTVVGKPSDDIRAGTYASIRRQAGWND